VESTLVGSVRQREREREKAKERERERRGSSRECDERPSKFRRSLSRNDRGRRASATSRINHRTRAQAQAHHDFEINARRSRKGRGRKDKKERRHCAPDDCAGRASVPAMRVAGNEALESCQLHLSLSLSFSLFCRDPTRFVHGVCVSDVALREAVSSFVSSLGARDAIEAISSERTSADSIDSTRPWRDSSRFHQPATVGGSWVRQTSWTSERAAFEA